MAKDVRTRLSEALDEAEKLANGALLHPTRFDPNTLEHVRDGTDDGVWHVGEHYHEGEVATSSGEIVVYDEGRPNADQALHIARWDPSTVLRLIERDRALLKQYDEAVAYYNAPGNLHHPAGEVEGLKFAVDQAAAFWLGTQEGDE